jgi:hypothetical protein
VGEGVPKNNRCDSIGLIIPPLCRKPLKLPDFDTSSSPTSLRWLRQLRLGKPSRSEGCLAETLWAKAGVITAGFASFMAHVCDLEGGPAAERHAIDARAQVIALE